MECMVKKTLGTVDWTRLVGEWEHSNEAQMVGGLVIMGVIQTE